MKNTQYLTVLGDSKQEENRIVIHPNDGFDIGFMTLDSTISIYTNISIKEFENGASESVPGKIRLENNCRMGTIELSIKYWQKIGKPKEVKLYHNNGKLLISST